MRARKTLIALGSMGGLVIGSFIHPGAVLPLGLVGGLLVWTATQGSPTTSKLPPSVAQPWPTVPTRPDWTGGGQPARSRKTRDPVTVFLEDARARGVIDDIEYQALQRFHSERATQRVRSTIAPPPPAGAARIPAPPPSAPAETPPIARAPVPITIPEIPRPSAISTWLFRARDLVASDLAVHGLTYLGVLLLFAGTLGFLLFSFGSVAVGLRPAAELAVPCVLLGSAIYLRARRAPFVATALGLLGGLLLPIFVFTSFVDGVAFPPELHGSTLIVVLVASALLLALGYAAYSKRVTEASVRFLVVPMIWLAAWAGGLAFSEHAAGEVDLRRWSSAQLATMCASVALSAAAVRFRPTNRLAPATRAVLLPGAAVSYVLSIAAAAAEDWPVLPVAVAGIAAITTSELRHERGERSLATQLSQVLVAGTTLAIVGSRFGAGAGGVAATAGYIGLLEWQARSAPRSVSAAACVVGLVAGLGVATVEPWASVIAFGLAAGWTHARRVFPLSLDEVPEAVRRTVTAVGSVVFPVGLATGLVRALPDGDALVALGATVLVVAIACRWLRRDDEFLSWWSLGSAAAVGFATAIPGISAGRAATGAALGALAVVVASHRPALRIWIASPIVAWAGWHALEAADVSVTVRAACLAAAGAVVTGASCSIRARVAAHAAAAGLVSSMVGLAISGDGWPRTIALAAWSVGWLAVVTEDVVRPSGVGELLRGGARATGSAVAEAVASFLPGVIAIVSIPFVAADLAARTGLTTDHRSWSGLVLSSVALGYAGAARTIRARRPLATIATAASVTLAGVGIAVSAPDAWPVIGALAALIAGVWIVGSELRSPVMSWVAWAASAPFTVLLASQAGVRTRALPIVGLAWGAALMVGGLALDDRREGRRRPGDGLRTRWLWPPVALGALGVPVGLSFVFSGSPTEYASWSLAVAALYVVVAVQLRAGSVTAASFALLSVSLSVLSPTSALDDPILFLPWAAALTATSLWIGRRRPNVDPWVRWDIAPLVVAHGIALVALARSTDVGSMSAVWAGFGGLSIAYSVVRRRWTWATAGGLLAIFAAGAAGPGWLALALFASAAGAALAASKVGPPARWVLVGASASFVAGAWDRFVVFTGWSMTQGAIATAIAAACLMTGTGAALRWRKLAIDRAASLAGLAALGSIAAVAIALDPNSATSARIASQIAAVGSGSLGLALAVSAARLLLPLQREASAFLLAATAVVLGLGFDVAPAPAVGVAAAAGVVGVLASLAIWRIRPTSPWLQPIALAAATADLVALVVAAGSGPRKDLLEAALLVTSLECGAAGAILRRGMLLALSPLLACGAWLLFASEALRGETQWFTAPFGLSLLAAAAAERWARRERGRPIIAPEILAIEVLGMVFLVGASLVEIVVVSSLRGVIAVILGVGVAIWGGLTRVRRRALGGAATILLAVILMLGAPIARLVPQVRGAVVWVALVAIGVVLLGAATMLERGRATVAAAVRRLDTLMEGWE